MLGFSSSYQQAIVLEGSYWKRRIEVVIKEYHKWRIYYKKRVTTQFLKNTHIHLLFISSHVRGVALWVAVLVWWLFQTGAFQLLSAGLT